MKKMIFLVAVWEFLLLFLFWFSCQHKVLHYWEGVFFYSSQVSVYIQLSLVVTTKITWSQLVYNFTTVQLFLGKTAAT